MVITHDYLVPHLNGEVYTRKPPLLFWMIAASYKLFGIKESSARIPAAVSGLLTVALTAAFASALFSPSVGFWSGIILATTPWFAWLARRAKMDVPTALFVILAVMAFYFGNLINRQERGKKFLLYLAGFTAVGVGALCKGPVAFSVPGLALALYHIHNKDLHILKEKEFWLAFPASLLIYLAWLVPACFKLGKGYALEQIYYRTSALFLHTNVHKHGPFYYFYHLLADAFPWVLLLPPALYYGLKLPEPKRRPFLLFFWWFTANFIFFSLAKTKRSPYLIPVYPAMAVIIALYLEEHLSSGIITRWMKYCLYATVVALPLAALTAIAASLRLKFLLVPSVGLVLLCALLAALGLLTIKENPLKMREFIALASSAMLLFSFTFVFPKLDVCKSSKKLCEEAVRLSEENRAPIVLFGITTSHAGEFNFYTKRFPLPVVKRKEVQKILESKERLYVITKGKYFKRYFAGRSYRPIYQQPCGHRFTLFEAGEER